MSMQMAKVLYVDDEKANLTNFEYSICEEFSVVTALSGEEALEIFNIEKDIAVVVADQRMPGMSGVEMLTEMYRINPEPIRIILTAYANSEEIIEAINKGHVYRYLLKPWSIEEVLHCLRNAREIYELTQEKKALIAKLRKKKTEIEKQAKELKEANSALESLIQQHYKARSEIEENLSATIKSFVGPLIEQLESTNLSHEQKEYIDLMKENIKNAALPLARHLTNDKSCLTPTELQIANFILYGKDTREITRVLKISPRTIETHRYNIRKKLGIKNKKINLRSYLLSL